MAHGSETEARLGGFLQKDAISRFAENRFDVTPINLDAHALDANVEKPTQAVALNSPAFAKFDGLAPIDGKPRDTRFSAGPVGRIFAWVTTLGVAATALLAFSAWGLQRPDFYALAGAIFVITALFVALTALASSAEI